MGLNESGVLQMPVSSFTDNDSTGLIELDPSVFGAEFRPDILQRSVRWYLANRRAGTHKTKSRSEVRGSTRKMWAQKGSGRARVGDRRAPQWRGGYTVHGKTPRDYSFDLPKKGRRSIELKDVDFRSHTASSTYGCSSGFVGKIA